ncbi:MAG: fatty acid desaturase [Sandaracinaceae bacterium]
MTEAVEHRFGRELIAATKPYQKENRLRSWLHVAETFGVMIACAVALFLIESPYVRVPLAIFQGFVVVRAFILYHDFMHLAILRGSTPAKWLMHAYGVLVLTPPTTWRQTHNYHHAHTAKIVGSHVGSYLMVTTDMWEKMTDGERLMYKVIRHPLTILFAYFTLFLYGMCLSSFMRNPRKNWDSAVAIVLNFTLVGLLWWFFGFWTMFFVLFVPLFVATAAGGYLFYAQHNFPEMHVQPRDQWEYTRAALESSSYMETGRLLRWLTGNIGYHHVHHLNSGIPFYRLPEAMAAIPELQNPRKTSLWPEDIAACFEQKLWDPKAERMVGYPE